MTHHCQSTIATRLILAGFRRPPQPSSHLSSQFANTCTQISSLNMHPGLGSTS